MLAHAWLVTSLNPKGILFFVAFFPQFIDAKADFTSQVLILEATFLVLASANVLIYATLASRARRLVKNARVIRAINRTGGAMLIGAGIAAAAVKSSG
jgi:threonine/homoserine/homoserine lactone efflux protein